MDRHGQTWTNMLLGTWTDMLLLGSFLITACIIMSVHVLWYVLYVMTYVGPLSTLKTDYVVLLTIQQLPWSQWC